MSSREIDDISPEIFCEKEYLEKADILWVIPNYKNIPISDNQSWCQEMLSLNKTLGMHGIKHYYREFESENITEEEFQKAINIFEECFNQTPTMFKAPNIKINKQNKELIKNSPLKLKNHFNQITHKVYHCNDTGILPNKFHDRI